MLTKEEQEIYDKYILKSMDIVIRNWAIKLNYFRVKNKQHVTFFAGIKEDLATYEGKGSYSSADIDLYYQCPRMTVRIEDGTLASVSFKWKGEKIIETKSTQTFKGGKWLLEAMLDEFEEYLQLIWKGYKKGNLIR